MSDSAPKCLECFTPMKPLFQSFFCPNDCDTPEGRARIAAAKAKMDIDFANLKKDPSPGWGFFYSPVQAP